MPGTDFNKKGLLWLILSFILAGCQPGSEPASWQTMGSPIEADTNLQSPILILGDIDPDTPTRRIQNIRPLADVIARKQGWKDSQVRIVIAQSVDQMTNMLKDGRVDIYLDSAYPSLLARAAIGSDILLLTRVLGERSYHGKIVTLKSSSIQTLDKLKEHNVAFQERYSTSGYLLPAAHMIKAGLQLQALAGPATRPAAGRVGYVFSGDEENTLTLLRKHIVVAGALSSPDYISLDAVVKEELSVLAETQSAPRKLVSVRPGFDKMPQEALVSLLLSIDDTDRQYMAEKSSWNWHFEVLDEAISADINAIQVMMNQVAEDHDVD